MTTNPFFSLPSDSDDDEPSYLIIAQQLTAKKPAAAPSAGPIIPARADEYKSTCSSSSSITETLLEVTRSLKLIESRAERTLSEVSFPTKLDNEAQDIDEAKMIALKKSVVQKRLAFLNQASKEELEGLKGIGKKRATDVLEFCKENPEPFKSINDLRELGLSQEEMWRSRGERKSWI